VVFASPASFRGILEVPKPSLQIDLGMRIPPYEAIFLCACIDYSD